MHSIVVALGPTPTSFVPVSASDDGAWQAQQRR